MLVYFIIGVLLLMRYSPSLCILNVGWMNVCTGIGRCLFTV